MVVGAGLAGLTAGALLARVGQRVVVVEAAESAGGCMRARTGGGFRFDGGPNLSGPGGPGEIFDRVLTEVGVRDRCRLLKVDPLFRVVLPGLEFTGPGDLDGHFEALAATFPSERAGLQSLLALCRALQAQAHDLPPSLPTAQLDQLVDGYATVFRYLNATAGEVVAEHIHDARARAVLLAPGNVLQLPPSQLSFLAYAQSLVCTLSGPFMCAGTFQSLADALAAGLDLQGGRLLVGTAAERIVFDHGRAAGVQLADGRALQAGAVIAAAGGAPTYVRLLGEDMPDSMRRRLQRLRPSHSTYLLDLATTLDLRERLTAYESFVFSVPDLDAGFQAALGGRPDAVRYAVPTLVDPTLAAPGLHLLTARVPAVYAPPTASRAQAATYQEAVLGLLERDLPGLRRSLQYVADVTPADLEANPGVWRGAVVGWEFSSRQAARGTLSQQPPIDGLYLAGHWTSGGSGVLRAVASGVRAAQLLMLSRGGGQIPGPLRLPQLPMMGLPASG
ncbi:MAG: NAD(P)/FAD-dependent oxidoreductase [Chloroflexota bacterium]